MTDSLARDLACIDCGATYSLGYRLECERCRGLLELRYDLERLRRDGHALLRGNGLWRYAAVLPIADPAHRLTLGEGGTPLLEAPQLARRLGVRRLRLKFEGANPTGTVKDRSSATAVAAALQFGFTATSVVSSGNAGSSIAAYSARAGLRALVFAYERTSAPKLLHMTATTPDLVMYKGVYDDLIPIWDRLVEDRVFFDCGASRNAYKHDGKKTIAYEIAEQSAWSPPDVVVAPVAVGETFIAAARGFREMHAAGWIPRVPRMVAAQAARANAVVRAFRRGLPSRHSRSATRWPRAWPRATLGARATGCYGCCARAAAWPVMPRTRPSWRLRRRSRAWRACGPDPLAWRPWPC